MATSTPVQVSPSRPAPIFTIAWVLLLIVGAFSSIVGTTWQTARQSSPGMT